ncbi:AI-2E family transporter, partial [Longimicrobium sp.]|uniref:AI-2E family transporter n=1 Tax=Longimicrobium sp. TaxID=2029185 RepID=UPI002F91E5D5
MDYAQIRRGPLPFLVGAAAVVILVGGMRAASGILNPMLMAGFLALLFQPLTRRLRRWGMAGGLAVTLVVIGVVISGLLLIAFVGESLRQIAVEFPSTRAELDAMIGGLSAKLA